MGSRLPAADQSVYAPMARSYGFASLMTILDSMCIIDSMCITWSRVLLSGAFFPLQYTQMKRSVTALFCAVPLCRYYLRSIGVNPRKEPSDIAAAFPELAADLRLPQLFPPDRLFSSVLRLSSGMHSLLPSCLTCAAPHDPDMNLSVP